MERCFALLFCLFVFASGQCCQKTVDYCPTSSVFPTTRSRSCTSFGSGHIHTFDGLSYDFREYGDFYLLTNYANPSGAFSIQVRQSDCSSGSTLAVPVNQKSTIKGSCNRAFVFWSGIAVEIRHDVNADYITVVVQGTVLPPSTNYGSVGDVDQLQVTPMSYVTTTADISRSSGYDSDFFVTGLFQGFQFNIWFYASGYSTFQILIDGENSFGLRLGGLCGFVDGCAANDLALRTNAPLNPPFSPPASIVETIRSTSEIAVTAGSLGAGNQFINQSGDPSKWAPAFGSSWRVDLSATAFSFAESDAPNLRWTASNYDISSSGSCNFPQGWSTPSFLNDQCSVDQQFKSDTVNGFPFAALPSWHVMWSYCSYYCANGVFPFLNRNLLPNQCNGYCVYPQGIDQGVPDITTVYGQAPNWNIPPVQFFQTTDPTALFTSSLNLAGQYTFKLTTSDSCESREYNITRTLTCSNSVTLQPATFKPVVRRIHTYKGIYPTVQVFIPVPSAFTRVQLTFIQLPDGLTTAPTFATLFGGSGALSLAPVFTPDPSFPGLYILQLSMYDGCSIVNQNISIIAACSSCAPVATIDNPNLKDFIWGVSFNSPVNGPQPPITQTFQTKNFFAKLPATNEPYTATSYDFEWDIINDDNSMDDVVWNGVNYDVRRYTDSSIAAFAIMYPNGTVINSTSSNFTDAPSVSSSSFLTPILRALKGPTNSQYGVRPPPREFDIARSDTTTTRQSTLVVTHFLNVSYLQIAPFVTPCKIGLTQNGVNGQNVSVQFLPQAPGPNGGFNIGSNCVGQYNLRLNVSEASCSWAKDDQKLDVDCGPTPDVFVKCLATTKFNYVTQTFPALAVDASASTDPYGRLLNYSIGYKTQPGNNTASITGGTTPTRTATVVDPGTYEVWVNVSNGCDSATTISTFVAYCTGSASEVSANANFNSPSQVIYDGTTFGSQQVTVTQNSVSTNPDVLTNLRYTWSFVNLIPNPTPLWISPPSFSATNVPAPTIVLTYQNTPVTIQMIASQGCGQFATQTSILTLYCDTQYAPTFTATPAQTTIAWVQNQGWTPNIPQLNGTPNFLFKTAPPQATGVNQNWMTDVPNFAANFRVVTSNGAGPLLYTPAQPILPKIGGATSSVTYWASDGCIFNNLTINLTWTCYGSTVDFTSSYSQVGNTSNYLVTLDASASNLSLNTTNLIWTIVPPTGSSVPTITPLNQTYAQFVASVGGVYNITLRYTDGCDNVNITKTFTHPGCLNLTLNPGAYLGNGAAKITAVTWANNGFPKFDLNGNGSDTGGRDLTSIPNYSWIVYAAPNASIYAPKTIVNTTTTLPTTTVDTPILVNGYYYIRSNITWTSTTNTTTTFVSLANSNTINANTWWPSCFYPDVEGTYVVGLMVTDSCQTQISNLTLQAVCAAAPSIGVNVTEHVNLGNDSTYVTPTSSNSWTVTLSRTAPRRIVLDARSTLTKTNSTSRLTFYWAWNAPDPRAGTLKAQDGFETPYASTSALYLSAVGTYNITLTVHDGCAVSTQALTITAVCGDKNVGGPVMSSNTNTDGRTYATLRLDSGASCGTNSWTLTNFTTASKYSGSGISSSALATNPTLTLLFPLFFSLFVSKFL